MEKYDNKDLRIKLLEDELLRLKKSMCLSDNDIREQIQLAYSDGVKAGSEKIPQMKEAKNNAMLLEICSEYDEQIARMESELSKVRSEYKRLYNYIENRILIVDKVVDVHDLLNEKSLSSFERPGSL